MIGHEREAAESERGMGMRPPPFPIFPFVTPGIWPLGVVAVAIFAYIRQQRRLRRRLDDLAAAVEGLARRADEEPPEIEEEAAKTAGE